MIGRALACLAFVPGAALAQSLSFPGAAELTLSEVTDPAAYALPTGPWRNGTLPTEPMDGAVAVDVWRIPRGTATTLQVLRPLRAQLTDAGYDVIFECDTDDCGGFDFRFAIPVSAPPAMFVDLSDFRFLAARHGSEDAAIGILVSRTNGANLVQVTQVGPSGDGARLSSRSTPTAMATPGVAPTGLAETLEASGRVVLSDLLFETGSAQLGAGPYASLEALAAHLALKPALRIGLVGHTDASGSLEANIALSKRRAGSVLERLVDVHGVPRRQLQAEGMGYLAPIANNIHEDGRTANRRVEAIILSTSE